MYYMNIYSYVYIGSSPYIKAIHTMQGDDKNKIIFCGVCGHVKINIYWGGQFEKNKKYDYE